MTTPDGRGYLTESTSPSPNGWPCLVYGRYGANTGFKDPYIGGLERSQSMCKLFMSGCRSPLHTHLYRVFYYDPMPYNL